MKNKEIIIDGRQIGSDYRPYIIAEMSGNHNNDIERAFDIICKAKESGADAVKLQTYTADTLTLNSDKDDFIIKSGLWKGRNLYSLYKEANTPWEWHEALFNKGREVGITIFSSPFDFSAVDFLEELNAPAYKIASFEAIDLPLIKRVAKTGKPVIISTGMSNLDEIEQSVRVAKESGCEDLILLHCISGYPTPPEESNLKTIVDLKERFDLVVGLSDHTLGTAVSVASVALGASVLEKHVTLNRDDGGPDSKFSLEPKELKELCDNCYTAWSALGEVNYARKKSESDNVIFRRSLYVVEDMIKGEKFTNKNTRSIRPGYGLAPGELDKVLGQCAKIDIEKGTRLSWELVG